MPNSSPLGGNVGGSISAMSESPLLGPTRYERRLRRREVYLSRGGSLASYQVRGEASGYGPRPIKNRNKFFECLHEGLQRYFDSHDKRFDGVIYLTVGVKKGHVGGIIKSDDPFPFAPKEYIGDGVYVEGRPPLIARKRDSLVLINQQSSQPTLLSRRPPKGEDSALAEKAPKRRGRKRKTTKTEKYEE